MSRRLALAGVILGCCGMLAGPILLGLVAVLFAASGQAAANTCLAASTSSTAGSSLSPATVAPILSSLPGQVGRYAGDQVVNAAAIIKAGQAMALDARTITIGVMTAMGESQLVNVDRGDAVGPDARGLFQQRANNAWGSYEDRMNPTVSSTNFFKALTGGGGYLSLEPTIAAHKVQRNADPYHYTPYWADAVQMVSTLTADPSLLNSVNLTPLLGSQGSRGCSAPVAAPTGVFADSAGTTLPPRANPRSVEQAIAWARQQAATGSGGWYRRCLAFVAQAYGWSFSGTPYAVDQYTVVMPTGMRHDGDRNPPPGALLFWSTTSRPGHVALYLGGGQIASNDIVTEGAISVVAATDIETKWGASYLGWAPPYFPGGGL